MVGHAGKVFIPIAGPWFFTSFLVQLSTWSSHQTSRTRLGGSKHFVGLQGLIGLMGLSHAPKQPPSWPLLPRGTEVFLWAEQQVGALAQVGGSSAALEGACCFQPPAAKRGQNLRSSSQMEQKN